jgi:hypothetical protein
MDVPDVLLAVRARLSLLAIFHIPYSFSLLPLFRYSFFPTIFRLHLFSLCSARCDPALYRGEGTFLCWARGSGPFFLLYCLLHNHEGVPCEAGRGFQPQHETKSIPFLLALIADVNNNPHFSKMLNYLKLKRAKVVSFAVVVVGWT